MQVLFLGIMVASAASSLLAIGQEQVIRASEPLERLRRAMARARAENIARFGPVIDPPTHPRAYTQGLC